MSFKAAWGLAAAGATVIVVSCTDSFRSGGLVTPPDSVGATALGQHAIDVFWVPSPEATGYLVERRANLTGPFEEVQNLSSGFETHWVNDGLDPETIYGYRVVALSFSGTRSEPSLVAGARTAPVPGIVATVATAPPELGSGSYTVAVAGTADTLTAPLAPLDQHRFSPLSPGTYHVTLRDIPANCSVPGGSEQTLVVTDQGLETLRYAAFNVSCRDPNTGRLTVNVSTTGDSLDVDGYTLTLSGIADDASLPDS